ncbi:MAG TPA: hypothetical protein VMM13_02675, partial [Euzebya sp.]|nr:hypothetical protein [Euzebya sp.]
MLRRIILAMVILTGSVGAPTGTAPAFSQVQSDTLSIIKDQTLPSNADIARDIAEATFTTVDTVLIA